MRCISVFFGLLFLSLQGYSQNLFVSDNIQTNTTWDADTVFLQNSIQIATEATLEIRPGVVILIEGPYSIMSTGTITALGTKNDSIHFIPRDRATGWNGIELNDDYYTNAVDSSIFTFCSFRYGKNVDYYRGGAVTLNQVHNVRFENCLFAYNRTANEGGAIIMNYANVSIINCKLIRNRANYGGAIYISSSSPIIRGNEISHNNAVWYGGGVYSYSSGWRMVGNLLSNNRCQSGGSALYATYGGGTLEYNTVIKNESSYGSALFLGDGYYSITNCTIADNKSLLYNEAAGLYISGSYHHSEIKNCIIYNNQGHSSFYQIGTNGSSSLDINSSNIMGGISGITAGSYAVFTGKMENVISTDPKFTNPALDDYSLSWTSFPVEDDTKSPCIDSGNMLDMSRDPDGSFRDMGAYPFFQTGKNFPPRTVFGADQRDGYKSLLVTFTSTSVTGNSPIISYSWDFGDGSTSTEQNPVHEYKGIDVYSVSLTVTDQNGLSHKFTQPDYITMHSQHYLKGWLSGTLVKDEADYVVGGNIYVQHGEQLIIEPGVKITFLGNYSFEIYGIVQAEGLPDNRITFTYYDTTGFKQRNDPLFKGGWGGITIANTMGIDSVVFDYCKIEYGKNLSGGALKISGNMVRISNSEIVNNSSARLGGGISLTNSSALIYNNLIADNYVGLDYTYGMGGGISISESSSPKIIKNIISRNFAAGAGGGLCVIGNSTPIIVNNLIAENLTNSRGGGIYISDTQRFKLVNNTIINNKAESGGGIFVSYGRRTDFFNSIFSDNVPQNMVINDYYTEVGFRNCIVKGGKQSIQTYNTLNIFFYIKCIDNDPGLVKGKTGYGMLLLTSPAIDKGYEFTENLDLPGTDLLNNTRVQNGVIDIGAFEYLPLPDPVLLKDSLSFEVSEDFQPISIGLDSIFGFPLGNDWLTYLVDFPENPLNGVSFSENSLQIFHYGNQNGLSEFDILAVTGEDTIRCAIRLNILPVNDPPQNYLLFPTVSVNQDFQPIYLDLRTHFMDIENEHLEFVIEPNTILEGGLTASIEGDFLVIIPVKDQVGQNRIFISASDGQLTATGFLFITVAPVLSTGEFEESNKGLYPNPTEGLTWIRMDEKVLDFRVEDSKGLHVPVNMQPTGNGNEVVFDLSSLSGGIYFIRVRSAGSKRVYRVLKL